MAASVNTLQHPRRLPPRSGVSSPRDTPAGLGRYQFQVLAGGVTDAVMAIGGLIFDRAMAGWDVSVVVDGDAAVDDRPIKILGARVATRLENSDDVRTLARPNMLAVAIDVMVRSDAVRRRVLQLGDNDDTDVLVWGRHHPTNFSRPFAAVRHQPSAAAQVFKAQALVAGGAEAMWRADEGFYSMSGRLAG